LRRCSIKPIQSPIIAEAAERASLLWKNQDPAVTSNGFSLAQYQTHLKCKATGGRVGPLPEPLRWKRIQAQVYGITLDLSEGIHLSRW
jgi:hypothetical protein